MENKYKKICLAASSGGHYEQILMLKQLLKEYDGFILTEKTPYIADAEGIKTEHVLQVNREDWDCWLRLIANAFISLDIYLKKKPDIVICTGALAMIPMCLLVKFFGGRLIFIESFAKVTAPTKTGRFLYKYADKFFVQWETMKTFYPDAEYLGGIY